MNDNGRSAEVDTAQKEGTCDVTVVLSTYNRSELLGPALDCLLNQESRGVLHEIIVVDNNSTDNTHDVIQAYMAQQHPHLRTLFECRQGLSYGLNSGIEVARGQLIAFTDDDIRVASDYVYRVAEAFNKHPKADFVGGKVIPVWRRLPPKWLTSKHWAPLALQDYGALPFYTTAENPICLLNKAFRRSVFDRFGLLRPEVGRIKDSLGSAEDHDLMLRIWHGGGQGAYIPDIVAYADVQDERLDKAYHRRWHSGHGKFSALLPVSPTSSGTQTCFGVPLKIYRRLVASSIGRLIAHLRGMEADAFYHENRVRYATAYIQAAFAGAKRLGQQCAQQNQRDTI